MNSHTRVCLTDGPLQDIGFSDAFQKCIKVVTASDETVFVQVPTVAVAREMTLLASSRVLVPQKEPVTEINLERVCLFLEHSLQRGL